MGENTGAGLGGPAGPVGQALRSVVETIVAKAPAGWSEATLTCTAGGGGHSFSGGYAVPDSLSAHHLPVMFAEVGGLGKTVVAASGWERVTLEVRCRPSGTHELVVFPDIVSLESGAYQIVFDADFRLPEAGDLQEAGTAAPAGDPELAVARFHEYMRRRADILGRPEPLPPPASEAEIVEAERRIGRPLPADLRALYSIADGEAVDYRYLGLFRYGWMSLKDLVDSYPFLALRLPGWGIGWDAVVEDCDPPETVRRCSGHPDRVPFGTREDGNYLAVDLAPARNGRPGQVIAAGRDFHDGAGYYADSVTSLLGGLLEMLDAGAYEIRDGFLVLGYYPHPPSGPTKSVGQLPGEIPASVQIAHINNAERPIDLAPLAACPNLRLLHLNRCSTSDLSVIRKLPVESLRATLTDARSDALAPLEGHRYLSALELATEDEIDIAILRTMPNLRGLDLSRAVVRDLTVVADLRELRFLVLQDRQWELLLERDCVPPALAAARIAGASLAETMALASRLQPLEVEPLRLTGKLDELIE
ncbi:SMI1/KNR4 family protein [Catenulispora sp. GP43]|uniref:SMI1/KNR4 family protein n=1 Tax=Catenulispora sp. GP43 TaxID=3156263 RepID=UPI00351303EB